MFVLIKLSQDGESVTEFRQADTLEEIEEDLREWTMRAIEEPGMSDLTEEALREEWQDGLVDLYLSLRSETPTLKELEKGTGGFAFGENNRKVVHVIQVTGNRVEKIL